MRTLTPAARLAFAGLGVVALLAVVGLASRGGLDGGGSGSRGPSGTLLDYGFTIFLVAYLLTIPFAIWAFFVQQRNKRLGGHGGRGGGLFSNLAIFVALVGAALALVGIRHARGDRPAIELPQPLSPERNGRQRPAADEQAPEFRWSVVVAAAALGAAGAGAFLATRRRKPRLREATGLTEELAFAFDDAIDGVRAESDPRRAVIKAYARTEQILGAHGLPREPAEAPYEYLERTLGTLETSAVSVERLTALFERAKFSLHEIGADMRENAIDALTAVRDELRSRA